MNDPIVIVSAARTPMGSFQGVFGSVSAPQLGAAAIEAAVGRAGIGFSAVSCRLVLARRRFVRLPCSPACRCRPVAR